MHKMKSIFKFLSIINSLNDTPRPSIPSSCDRLAAKKTPENGEISFTLSQASWTSTMRGIIVLQCQET
jgi:hypothetical protein